MTLVVVYCWKSWELVNVNVNVGFVVSKVGQGRSMVPAERLVPSNRDANSYIRGPPLSCLVAWLLFSDPRPAACRSRDSTAWKSRGEGGGASSFRQRALL